MARTPSRSSPTTSRAPGGTSSAGSRGEFEGASGIEAALADGSLRARIDETAARREEEVARRRRPLTGVTEFPNLAEVLPEREPDETVGGFGATAPSFEALRDDPATTPVFLATMGSVAAHTARATFASNLLAAGGIAVDVAGPTANADELVAAYDGQPVVCLAGSDPTYAEWAPAAITALRDAGARWVILAGADDLERRRLLRDGRRRPRLPEPHEGAPRMSIPKSFAGLPTDEGDEVLSPGGSVKAWPSDGTAAARTSATGSVKGLRRGGRNGERQRETPPGRRAAQATVRGRRGATWGEPTPKPWHAPKASTSSRCTAPNTSRASTRSTPCPG